MKTIISTDKAPGAIGPYSQAVKVGYLLFCSGQIPIDPAKGEIVETTVEGQTRQVLENIKGLLESAGATMDDVVKTTCFIQNMSDFATLNGVYGEYFSEGHYPARSAVEVSALPKGVLVEIEVIAEIN